MITETKSIESSETAVFDPKESRKMKHRIGLVLAGGGAKGAYQIGVWRALKETKLDKYVTDIAGTSVGGLNAALFVKGDYEEAVHIWSEEISSISLPRIQMGVSDLVDKHLDDMSFFDQKKPYHDSPINCFITACNTSKKSKKCFKVTENGKGIEKCISGKAEYFNMRFVNSKNVGANNKSSDELTKENNNKRKELLKNASMRKEVFLATSALPLLCKSLKINKNHYVDGGVADNSPVYPLLEATNCDTIIVVHLDSDKKSNIQRENPNDVKVLEIVPSQDAGHLVGTLDFNPEKSRWLMELGYNDTIKVFNSLVKNWAKENMLSESGDKVFQLIDHLSLEDKYRLYNECEFLVRGNYAKLNYISEEGFGKTIFRVITGSDAKTKKQILENSVDLQGKLVSILVCLDDEMINIKQGMHYLFYRSLAISDILLTQYRESKIILDVLNGLIDHNEYNDRFLAEKYSDYKMLDMNYLKKQLDEITIGINVRIDCINELNQKALEIHEAQIEATAKRISEAKKVRIIRFIPQEAIYISSRSIHSKKFYGANTNSGKNKVDDNNIEKELKKNKVTAIVLPEGNKHPPIKTIRTADYFMYLWFVNTPISERSGKTVYMIDYCDKMYLYGYKVCADGDWYSEFQLDGKKTASHTTSASTLFKKLTERLGITDTNKDNCFVFRTFETIDKKFEDALNNTEFDITINKVDFNWEKTLSKNDKESFVGLVDRFVKKIYE